jgi:hypothetical protein
VIFVSFLSCLSFTMSYLFFFSIVFSLFFFSFMPKFYNVLSVFLQYSLRFISFLSCLGYTIFSSVFLFFLKYFSLTSFFLFLLSVLLQRWFPHESTFKATTCVQRRPKERAQTQHFQNLGHFFSLALFLEGKSFILFQSPSHFVSHWWSVLI